MAGTVFEGRDDAIVQFRREYGLPVLRSQSEMAVRCEQRRNLIQTTVTSDALQEPMAAAARRLG